MITVHRVGDEMYEIKQDGDRLFEINQSTLTHPDDWIDEAVNNHGVDRLSLRLDFDPSTQYYDER